MDRINNISNHLQFMATTDRHSELVDAFTADLRPWRRRCELQYWSDTVALVYEGMKLIDVNGMPDIEKQKLQIRMNQLNYKEPDVMVFHHQVFLNNRKNTRKAGCPDLIIEIWSDDNDEIHRKEKFEIYASSEFTEHWYMEQESDIVKCFLGTKRLPDQHLKNILKSQSGLEFDLTDLQTFDDSSWESFIEYGYKG